MVTASRGGEHREKRALRGQNPGKFLREGEIDAIAIVIERDIISIIIISTIYTAIITAAPRHRCSNSGISMNEVRKKLFTISLSGKAAHWYKLLKNGDSIDWEDIVPLFYSKFYPPSEIHKDRNRIYNFWPHDGESIAQAWGRLKSLMLKCPIHELPQHLENSESEAFRKERDELEEIFRRQPILKHDLPVEDLGTTPPPKEDPVFDLKPLPDNLKYAHIDDKKIYPVIISSKLSEIEEESTMVSNNKDKGLWKEEMDERINKEKEKIASAKESGKLRRNCKLEKLKLKEILRSEKNPSPSSPKE
ncbi:hypothetical protein QYE76_037020 [Lolium multiflorum]|uniref:Retrotransposon gag domain-containing protein n=1 Tax=Lolium multiflorum TaxID=4521 RepID=A0AAD8R3Z8_LOLMU|nr:hypothetical protein QYE76_037020 [Lolium multiflorum]